MAKARKKTRSQNRNTSPAFATGGPVNLQGTMSGRFSSRGGEYVMRENPVRIGLDPGSPRGDRTGARISMQPQDGVRLVSMDALTRRATAEAFARVDYAAVEARVMAQLLQRHEMRLARRCDFRGDGGPFGQVSGLPRPGKRFDLTMPDGHSHSTICIAVIAPNSQISVPDMLKIEAMAGHRQPTELDLAHLANTAYRPSGNYRCVLLDAEGTTYLVSETVWNAKMTIR